MDILDYYIKKEDERGWLWGITQEPWIKEINYIETNADEIRGNHYHTETKEMFFIIEGKVNVTVYNIHTAEREEYVFEKGDIFIVYPYEVHTFYSITYAKWINMLSKPVKNGKSDFNKYELKLIKPI